MTDEFSQATAKHIQEEHLLAAQGAYMAFVEGHRHAEDDEHTEVMSLSLQKQVGDLEPVLNSNSM